MAAAWKAKEAARMAGSAVGPTRSKGVGRRDMAVFGGGAATGALGATAVHRRGNVRKSLTDVAKAANPYGGLKLTGAKINTKKVTDPFTGKQLPQPAMTQGLKSPVSLAKKPYDPFAKAAGDENSSPKVTTLQARRRDGKFASNLTFVEVHRPTYKTGTRMPRQSTLMHYTKGSVAKGMLQTSSVTKEFGARAHVGRRIT